MNSDARAARGTMAIAEPGGQEARADAPLTDAYEHVLADAMDRIAALHREWLEVLADLGASPIDRSIIMRL